MVEVPVVPPLLPFLLFLAQTLSNVWINGIPQGDRFGGIFNGLKILLIQDLEECC